MPPAMRLLCSSLFILLTHIASSVPVLAADEEENRRSLQGLRGVHIEIEDFYADETQDNLTVAFVRELAESQFRMHGIRILSEEEWLRQKGFPFLNIIILTDNTERDEFYSYSIHLDLNQVVVTQRNANITVPGAVTWSVDTLAFATRDEVKARITSSLGALLGTFISAYLSVN